MALRTRSAGVRGPWLASILVATIVLGGCSDDGAADDTATTSPTETVAPTTSARPGPPEGAVERGLRELAPGDCFDPVDDATASDRAVWLIDCVDPHTHEVYDVLTYEGEGSGPGTPYPGVAVVQNWSEQACHDRFEGFVGLRWTLSELDMQVWWPSADSWAQGDRGVICTVFSPRGERLRGSQQGAAR